MTAFDYSLILLVLLLMSSLNFVLSSDEHEKVL